MERQGQIMAWIQARIDRLRYLIALLLKERVNPKSPVLANRVMEILSAEFGLRPQTAKQYSETLKWSWRRNRWLSYIKDNPYLSKEEQEKWIKKLLKER